MFIGIWATLLLTLPFLTAILYYFLFADFIVCFSGVILDVLVLCCVIWLVCWPPDAGFFDVAMYFWLPVSLIVDYPVIGWLFKTIEVWTAPPDENFMMLLFNDYYYFFVAEIVYLTLFWSLLLLLELVFIWVLYLEKSSIWLLNSLRDPP